MLQELISAEVPHCCREIPVRLSLSSTRGHWYCGCSYATGPFQSSPVLPAHLLCERATQSCQLSPMHCPGLQKSPSAPHHGQGIKALPHHESIKARAHREARLTQHKTAAVLAPCLGHFGDRCLLEGQRRMNRRFTAALRARGHGGPTAFLHGAALPRHQGKTRDSDSLQGALPAQQHSRV